MDKAYVVVPMPIQTDIRKWIKIILPLDTYDIVEKTQWCWNSVKQDAFPLGDLQCQNSFRMLARLFGNAVFDINKQVWDLTKCERSIIFEDSLTSDLVSKCHI